MKILVGIDRDFKGADRDLVSPIVGLLERLRFPSAKFDVVRVLHQNETYLSGMEAFGLAPSEKLQQGYVEELYEATPQLARVAAELLPIASSVDTAVLTGNPVSHLLERADKQERADLIAVNASQSPSPLTAFLTGSVARALVIGAHQSVLIARCDSQDWFDSTSPLASKPIRALLATDHSPYANRCIAQLGQFAPAGIQHIGVMTAYPADRLRRLGARVGEIAIDPAEAVRDELAARNETIINILSPHFPRTTFSSHVVNGQVDEAIEKTGSEVTADLVILGAKGHSVAERTVLGSVSFRHAIVNSRQSVLILRV